MDTIAIEHIIHRKLITAQKLQADITEHGIHREEAESKLRQLQHIKQEIEILIHSVTQAKTTLAHTQIAQELIAFTHAHTYLEIGISKGDCFSKITAPRKIGIDIIPPADAIKPLIQPGVTDYFEMPSNDFFTYHAADVLTKGIDVALVDGLHEYKQTYRDITHVTQYLNEDGFIVIHDCNPLVKEYAQPPEKDNPEPPIPNAPWCGDVWKAIVHLRATRKDLNIFTLNCDYGVGIIEKGTPESMLDIDLEILEDAPYNALAKARTTLVNLKEPEYFFEFLAKKRQLQPTR